MQCYLVHHGAAVPPGVDPQRPLSADGRARVEHVAATAAQRRIRPVVIWHSGKLRARQTAEVFCRACNPLADVAAARGLQPSDPPDRMADALGAETRDIMLVGHLPNIERLLRLLIDDSDERTAVFPTHGIVALEAINSQWMERWRIDG